MSAATRLSPVHPCLAALDPKWVINAGMATALRFDENDLVRKAILGVADFSCLLRCGLKGPNSRAWLLSKGLPIPEINCWLPLPQGGLIARLGVSEFMLEDAQGNSSTTTLWQELLLLPDGVYPVLRQDAALVLCGDRLPNLLGQTCNLNFKLFDLPRRQLALTSMVGVSVLIIPNEKNGQPYYRVWFDATYGNYMWQTLVDIAKEEGGGAVGLASMA